MKMGHISLYPVNYKDRCSKGAVLNLDRTTPQVPPDSSESHVSSMDTRTQFPQSLLP